MSDNSDNPLQWLAEITISKCIPTLLTIYICGYAINGQIGYSTTNGKVNSFVESLFIGLGSFSISFLVAFIILRNYIIQIIIYFQIDQITNSLLDAFIFTMTITTYLPISFLICVLLQQRNKKRGEKEDKALTEDLFKNRRTG